MAVEGLPHQYCCVTKDLATTLNAALQRTATQWEAGCFLAIRFGYSISQSSYFPN